MVNPLGHWLQVLFCTRSWIPLRGLSGPWGIGFRIPFRVLSVFWFPPGLVVPASQLVLVNHWVKCIFMQTDVLKISKEYTNQLANMMINSSIKQSQRMPWYPHLSFFLKTAECHRVHLCLSNKPKLENHFVNLPQHWMSNQIITSTGDVLLNQSARKLEQAVRCSKKPQRGRAIQKSMKMLRLCSIIGSFSTHKLFSIK